MLFRTSTGELVELKKYSFKNDTLYYEKLLEIKTILEKSFDNEKDKQPNKESKYITTYNIYN
jgi:hypothetical protein